MTTREYSQFILEVKREFPIPPVIDEAAARETSQLISGNFIYPLYEALWVNHFDTDTATKHLESLYDSGNHFGVVYFIFILANAVELIIPAQFVEMSANDVLVPILSSAIIEDWLDYDAECEPTEYKD